MWHQSLDLLSITLTSTFPDWSLWPSTFTTKNITTQHSPNCCLLCWNTITWTFFHKLRAAMPIASLHQDNFTTLTYLVKESIIFSNVSTFSNTTLLLSTVSLKKWYYTSICFVLEWYVGFFARNIALWMSQFIFIALCSNPIPEHNLCNHTAYLLPWVASMYSASVVVLLFTHPANCSIKHIKHISTGQTSWI
jgi:hypothetical protein